MGKKSTKQEQPAAEVEPTPVETKKRKAADNNELDVPKKAKATETDTPQTTTPATIAAPATPVPETCCVRLRGLPFKSNEEEVEKFFSGFAVVSVKVPKRSKASLPTGQAIVTFSSPTEAKRALSRDKGYIGERYVEVVLCDETGNLVERPPKPEPAKPQAAKPAATKEKSVAPKTKSAGGASKATNVVFVAGIHKDVKDENIHKLFRDCGEISEIRWINDKVTGQFRGCGCVEFKTPEAAKLALAKSGQELFGYSLRVNPAQPKESYVNSS
eukprot:c25879_g1_i1.p1 GENE.c25879_g1_i1~~c25879_g1_i1.p1  ORF type:complete len:286 (-),score=67.20 c25879_g1_i1:84-899(-)